MSRTLSSTFLSAVFAQETTQVFLCILDIIHADLDETIRVVNNTEDIVSNGNTYIGFPFSISLPADVENQLPAMSLSIDNVDRTIVNAVRTISSPPIVSLSVILASAPNTIEMGPIEMTLRQVDYDDKVVTGTLEPYNLLIESFPKSCFTPSRYEALY